MNATQATVVVIRMLTVRIFLAADRVLVGLVMKGMEQPAQVCMHVMLEVALLQKMQSICRDWLDVSSFNIELEASHICE